MPHLQYFSITPHVHQNRSGSATLWSEATYDLIRASAISATTSSFVVIAGQEVSTISSGGHWSLFNASDMVGTKYVLGVDVPLQLIMEERRWRDRVTVLEAELAVSGPPPAG